MVNGTAQQRFDAETLRALREQASLSGNQLRVRTTPQELGFARREAEARRLLRTSKGTRSRRKKAGKKKVLKLKSRRILRKGKRPTLVVDTRPLAEEERRLFFKF